jgi:hypothetical protein
MFTSKPVAALAGAACLSLLFSASPAPSQAKEPPACAAINFRGIPAGLNDGVQNAGLYRSRYIGLLEVRGNVKGGQVESYFVTVNNKPPGDAGSLPKSVADCAATKHLPAPGAPAAACLGERLTVLIGHAGDKRYVLLYAREGAAWHLCSAGTA